MTDPHQIRRALTEIRKALDSHSRESMSEILALIFKEYVVESAQPLASSGNVIDARSDLEGMLFPELVLWLQTHLDVPELALFEVAGGDVVVRSESGTPVRLRARANNNAPAPVAAPAVAATPVAAPPVVRAAPMPIATPAAATSALGPAAPASTGAVTPDEKEKTSESGTRFSLLEVD